MSAAEVIPDALDLGNEIAQHSSLAIKQAKIALDFGAGISALLSHQNLTSDISLFKG